MICRKKQRASILFQIYVISLGLEFVVRISGVHSLLFLHNTLAVECRNVKKGGKPNEAIGKHIPLKTEKMEKVGKFYL